MLIDGAPPPVPLHLLTFPHTGGYSIGQDNWSLKIPEENGQPVTLALSAGEHTIRMINRGGGLGLDWIALVKAENIK